MSKKVKVNKRVFEALGEALRISSREELLNDHTRGSSWSSEEFIALNELSVWEMANILINGYEVEERVEEKLLAKFNLNVNECNTNSLNGNISAANYYNGVINGINSALETLDIKIKGINE